LYGKTYLNGKTLLDLLKVFTIKAPILGYKKLEEDAYFELLKSLKRLSVHYKKEYFQILKSINKGEAFTHLQPYYDMKLAQIRSDGIFIPNPHYTYESQGSTIHVTSNVPLKLGSDQRSYPPLPSAIREGAQNPGTIVTKTPTIRWSVNSAGILVPTLEIDVVKNDHPDVFEVTTELEEHLKGKTLDVQKVVTKAFGGKTPRNVKEVERFIIEFKMGAYDQLLIESSPDL
jgi:hypothetical protein